MKSARRCTEWNETGYALRTSATVVTAKKRKRAASLLVKNIKGGGLWRDGLEFPPVLALLLLSSFPQPGPFDLLQLVSLRLKLLRTQDPRERFLRC